VTVAGLGALLLVQCETCKRTRQFNVGLARLAGAGDKLVIEESNVVRALTALGWRQFTKRIPFQVSSDAVWLCSEACRKVLE
jgi:hypothetical protein